MASESRDTICERFGIDPERVPRHVALILDGNGRWAARHELDRNEGHRRGEQALWDVVDGALEIGIPWITVYVFSTDNWRRPKEEVQFLIWFNREILLSRRDEANEKGIRVRFLGRRQRPVPKSVLDTIDETEDMTRGNRRMTLSFCFNYGGRAEIIDAVKQVAVAVEAGDLDPAKITERTIARHLYAPDMPDPDLVIRTSGELRTSNFLLWESAYSEWIFPRILWPDFRRRQLFECIARYQRRERRFGALSDETDTHL